MSRLTFFIIGLIFSTQIFGTLDHTHDPRVKSWVESANRSGTDFPIQNLPYGVFRRANQDETPRIGIAIGDEIFDLRRAVDAGLFDGLGLKVKNALKAQKLNEIMALDRKTWKKIRYRIHGLLREDTPVIQNNQILRDSLIVPMTDAQLLMPVDIGDFTDFYASIEHAKNIGKLFRPESPLIPNYKHMPIAYHARSSSIVLSDTPIVRPSGLVRGKDDNLPRYVPSKVLDYEIELGAFIGTGNPMGKPIKLSKAQDYLFGMVIVNDWSARDIQRWEYQPLGPFNGKNFATTISPWVVTFDALEPYRVQERRRHFDDPPLHHYLESTADMGYEIAVEVFLGSELMRQRGMDCVLMSRSNFNGMYWNFPQMVTQHTCSGCNMRPGDLIASGTISGNGEEQMGCLLEMVGSKNRPLKLPDGSTRRFLEDGDQVVMRAYAKRGNFARVGFGENRGIIIGSE